MSPVPFIWVFKLKLLAEEGKNFMEKTVFMFEATDCTHVLITILATFTLLSLHMTPSAH